uniref:Uncharacterized protein n=1 Tax=viral metagenome TaxID=1070528 RepID=A0A6H2A3Z0_9ZZZZ
MKCPLLAFAWGNEGGKEPLVYPDCIRQECAWWDKVFEQCDPTGLAHTLARLTNVLSEVERRMPHAGQFTE